MAANISTFNGKVEFAYVGESPWWGIGNGSLGDEGVSGERILAAAHLDWTVSARPLYFQSAEGGAIDREATGRRAVVRDDNNAFLGDVSDSYQPIQNATGADILDALAGEGCKFEIAGALGRGERVWVLAKIADNFEVVKGDSIESRVLVTWGHDGRTKLLIKPVQTRVVCQNTLGIALGERSTEIAIKHFAGAKLNIVEAREKLGLVLKQSVEAQAQYAALAAKRISPGDFVSYSSQVFPLAAGDVKDRAHQEKLARWEAHQAQVLALYEGGKGTSIKGVAGTAWAAYNAVTEYVDHVYPVLASGKVSPQRQESALFGSYADTKVKALNLALAIPSLTR